VRGRTFPPYRSGDVLPIGIFVNVTAGIAFLGVALAMRGRTVRVYFEVA
jgi:hypothetical protein